MSSQSFAMRPGASSAMVPHDGGGGGGQSMRNWSARFPVYQIDFTAVASGKRIATTKRRVRWRFGFPNKEALDNGETGTACRGEEHDVTIVWSVTSGKRLILADGQEVHYSTNRSGVLEYSWTMRGNHALKVVAHAAPQMTPTPGFRQYDLYVDGQSFFTMPKVYELGIKGPIPAHAPVPGVLPRSPRSPSSSGRYYDLTRGEYISSPQTREQEEQDLQAAIQASLEESRAHLNKTSGSKRVDRTADSKHPAIEPAPAASSPPAPAPAPASEPAGDVDLLDFGAGEPAPAALPPSTNAPTAHASYGAAPAPVGQDLYAMVPAPGGPSPYSSDLIPTDQFSAPAPPQNYGAPAAVPSQNFGAPPPPSPGHYYGAPVQQQYGAPAPAPVQPVDNFVGQQPPPDLFAPGSAPAVDDPFAPKPVEHTYNDISSSILGAYGPKQSGGAQPSPYETVPTSGSAGHQFGPTKPHDLAPEPAAGSGGAPPYQLSINTGYYEEPPTKEEEADDANELTKAMKKLINFDDISSPVESERPLTMNPSGEKDDKRRKSKNSRGIPPPAKNWAGPQPTLQEMKTVKPAGDKKLVMKAPWDPAAADAGALVVHGTQNGNYGGYGQGPPPIAKTTGFGVGAQVSGGEYGAPMQPPQQGHSYGGQPQGYGGQPQGYGAQPHGYGMQSQGFGAPPNMQYQQQQQQSYPPQQQYRNYNF